MGGNGQLVGSSTGKPRRYRQQVPGEIYDGGGSTCNAFDTTKLSDGVYKLAVTAKDATGQAVLRLSVNFNVLNKSKPTPAPTPTPTPTKTPPKKNKISQTGHKNLMSQGLIPKP